MLTYQFSSTWPVELKELRFPFSMAWHAERGVHHIRRGFSEGLFREGGCVRIGAEELLHICLVPDQTGAVAGTIELEVSMLARGSEPDWDVLDIAFSARSSGFGLILAQAMFSSPGYEWRLEVVAEKLNTTRRRLQQRLFREAYSFSAALHRCRQLHSLLNRGEQLTRALDGQILYPIEHLPRSWSSRQTKAGNLVM